MLDELANAGSRIVGFKQVKKACEAGELKKVFIAADADEHMRRKLIELAKGNNIEYTMVASKKLLGNKAGISVDAACAAIVKNLS